jgi:hypothetical protein
MKRTILSTLIAVALISMALPALCNAQTAATATVLGMIFDPQGAVAPNATVVARNVDTGIERTTKTTSEGLYRLDNLPPGIYDVRVDAQGFAKAEAKSIKLQVGEQRDVNFNLVISSVTEKVEVTTATLLMDKTRTDVSTVINDKEVAVLPVTGTVSNDYANLALIAPGVKFDANTGDLLGPGQINNRGNLYNVDGGNITDQVVSNRDALGASLEEVKEFQVLTNNYNAEYGQAGGIILNVITRSGTNDLHGDGHIYFRGRNLTASTFFYNLSDEARFHRAPFHKREGGFTAGGPVVKNRTFWFASYEQTSQASPLTLTPPGGNITVPQPKHELLWSAKLDHQLTKGNHITARFNVQRDFADNLLNTPQFATPESLVLFDQHDHTLNLSLTSILTTRTVNEARFFWHSLRAEMPTKSSQPGQFGPNFYRGADFCCPQGALQHRYQYIDNLSWIRGTHALKTGFNISHLPYLSLFQQFHFGLYTGFQGPAPAEGRPTSLTIGLGPGEVNSSDNIYGFYVQDTWKLKPNLTLNYGLRYDLEVGAFAGGTIPNKEAGGCLQGNGIIPACASDHNNFQPRFGIAWSPRYAKGFLHMLFGGKDRTVIRLSLAEVTQLAFLNVVLDSLTFDGVALFTTTITDPSALAFYPNSPPANVLARFVPQNLDFFGRVRPISNDLRNPETRHANLTLSRQIGANFVLDLGYTGVFGFGLFGERDTNFATVKPDPRHPGFFYFGPRPDPRFAAVRTNENSRTSHYESFFAHTEKRLSHHFQFQAGYTLSKLISSTEDFTSRPSDPRNIRAERALAFNDTRHQVNFSVVYDTAQLSDIRLIKHIVNNWTIGLIGQLQSARPYTVETGDAPFVGLLTQQRPNVLPDGTLVSTNIAGISQTNLLVSEAGRDQCHCPQTTFLAPDDADPGGAVDIFTGDTVDFQFVNGNLGRSAAIGEPYYRLDMSFVKSFHIRDQVRLELKADFFNILNQTNFLFFNDALNNLPVSTDPNCRSCLNAFTGHYIGTDGHVLKIQDLRHGRVSRNIANPIFGGLGDPISTDIARTIQLSIRIRF